MRKFLIGLGIAAVAVAGVGYAYGARLALLAMLLLAHPPHTPFDRQTPPPAPDYAQAASWAALPGTPNATDATPAGVARADPAAAQVDVFFIYPTSFFSNDRWNAPLDDKTTNDRTDDQSLRNQASAFNGCCRIYAPRYRQMTLGGFLQLSPDSVKAMDLAYSDVKRAFEYYLAHDNRGRPFIVASHSQGSHHATRLIAETIDGTPLMKQFVAAYVIGNWLPESWFAKMKDVRPCRRADDTACVVTWSTLLEGADAQRQRDGFVKRSGLPEAIAHQPFACTNPLTWTTASTPAPASDDIGGWIYGNGGNPPAPHLVSARCDDGALFISDPGPDYRAGVLPGGNYHDYDYQLAYMNIRANAQARADAFLAAHPGRASR